VKNLNENARNEMSIYDAIMRWIRHNKASRKIELPTLLSLIDLHKLPSDFLEDVVAVDPLVKKNFQCLSKVMPAITKQLKKMRLREHGSKFICVGEIKAPNKVVEVCNLFNKAALEYLVLPSSITYSKALELDGYICKIGGIVDNDKNNVTNKIFLLNT